MWTHKQLRPLWANLVQKIKDVSLSWNLVPTVIRICRIQWWCSLFLFYTENTFFYCFCNPAGVETLRLSCRQHGFFILLQWVPPWIAFVHSLNVLKHLKLKQTFYFTWINFLLEKLYKLSNLDWIFHVTWTNLFLMKHKLINFDWIIKT